jgi:SEC-C motif-containing protein
MTKKPAPKSCPCTSGLAYKECCAPYHRGERVPPDCEALVRARFAAFALGDGAFLVATLHPDHELLAGLDSALVAKELERQTKTFRYMRLTILDRTPPDVEGIAKVLFRAGVFERGVDRSFVELSNFSKVDGSWRYRDGQMFPPDKPPEQR